MSWSNGNQMPALSLNYLFHSNYTQISKSSVGFHWTIIPADLSMSNKQFFSQDQRGIGGLIVGAWRKMQSVMQPYVLRT